MCDSKLSLQAGGRLADPLQGAVSGRYEKASFTHCDYSGFGESDAWSAPVDQRDPYLLFEDLDLLA
ncbi:hypothetical protein WSS_A00145 [Rhodococcus opacus M213]|uniref:Uncharacterized protein n=2 Tax=Rhodococcus opacus TaxID=37919 RepID=K8Y4S3_RHOOP|nr:hypothetical protein R1CP_32620 [Rhodococcus opacus]EKT84795.1 hypothetical protein WSS_A00145 [Rhodococcus opacus M213]